MIGKMFGRKKDKAIIHQSVPEEVLYPNGRKNSESDTSWMDDVFSEEKPKAPSGGAGAAPKAAPARKQSAPAPSPTMRSDTAAEPVAATPFQMPAGDANVRTEGRPKFPVGWLVTIEGASTGEWFPLERGLSTMGPDDAATIPVSAGAAVVAYDEAQNAFVLSTRDGATVRLNGIVVREGTRLRDGDVIGFDGTALKLVALCNGNFRWSDADRNG